MIRLVFTDRSADESSFIIERAYGPGGPYAEVGRVPGTAAGESDGRVFFEDTGVNVFTTYAYRVRAAGDGGTSDPSDRVLIHFSPGPPPENLGGAFFSGPDFTGASAFYGVEPAGDPGPPGTAAGGSAVIEGTISTEFNEPYTFYTASGGGVALTVIDLATGRVLVDSDHLAERRELPAAGFQDVAGTAPAAAYLLRIRLSGNGSAGGYRVGWSSRSTPRELLPDHLIGTHWPGGPKVIEVYATGASWPAAVKAAAGPEGFGAAVGIGPPRPAPAPWINGDQVTVLFDRHANVAADDLLVRDASGGPYRVTSFNRTNLMTATWTLDRPLAAGAVVELDGDAGGVTSAEPATAGEALDGEWATGANRPFSGDGRPGGDFRVALSALPGDVTGDGVVNALDLADVKRRLGRTTSDTTTGPASYSPFSDVTADGRINALDLAAVKQRLNTRLPAAQPATASLPPVTFTGHLAAASITREVFGSEALA